MNSQQKDPIQGNLTTILDALAAVLIPLGITPAHISQAARNSFVKISAQQARVRSSGRPHLARIAALTGLPRSEVKKIVSSGFRSRRQESDLPRAYRVLNGWMTSSDYLTRGKPRALPILGKKPSFDSLCKTFSGDIPRKVILDELTKLNLVTVSPKTRRVAVTPRAMTVNRASTELQALTFAASIFSEALRPDALVLKRRQRIATTNDFPDKYVESAVASRLSELLDQIPELFKSKGKSARHILSAYALIVRPRRNASARRKG